MNKYLMLSAAAVLATTGSALAGGTNHTFTFGTSGGGSYCDGGSVWTGADGGANSGSVRAWAHTNDECAGLTSEGQGNLGKFAGLGKVSEMSDTYLGQFDGIFSEQLSYTLPKKIHDGKPWTLWIGINGSTSFEGNSGPLVNTAPGHHPSKGTVSSASVVKGLIQARVNGK